MNAIERDYYTDMSVLLDPYTWFEEMRAKGPVCRMANRDLWLPVTSTTFHGRDIFAPVAGEITAVNEELDDKPQVINSDPYGAGWLFEVKLADASGIDDLLSAEDYTQQVG